MYLFRNVPTVETISLVVIDGPVVCSLAGWLPRAVSEYLSFQLVALSGAADIVCERGRSRTGNQDFSTIVFQHNPHVLSSSIELPALVSCCGIF